MIFDTDQEKYDLLELRDLYFRKQGTFEEKATCPDMCPEKERYLRQIRQQISVFELQDDGNGDIDVENNFINNQNVMSGWLKKDTTRKLDHHKAIKEYSRSAADQEISLPNELRTLDILEYTINYLILYIMGNVKYLKDESKYGEYYNFIWSRTRAIRKDITQQGIFYISEKTSFDDSYQQKNINNDNNNIVKLVLKEITATNILEKIARWHIFCSYFFSHLDPHIFDPKLNNEHLTKCVQALKQLYSDLSSQVYLIGKQYEPYIKSKCHEAEFQAYYILMNLELTQGDVVNQIASFSSDVYNSEEVKLAMSIFCHYHNNNYKAFFRILRTQLEFLEGDTDCHLAPFRFFIICLAHRYFEHVRSNAINIIISTYKGMSFNQQNDTYQSKSGMILSEVSWLAKQLFFEDIEATRDFVETHSFYNEDGLQLVLLDRLLILSLPTSSHVVQPSFGTNFSSSSRKSDVGDSCKYVRKEPLIDSIVFSSNLLGTEQFMANYSSSSSCPIGCYVYGDPLNYPPSLPTYEPTVSFDRRTGQYIGQPNLELFVTGSLKISHSKSMATSINFLNRAGGIQHRPKSVSPPRTNTFTSISAGSGIVGTSDDTAIVFSTVSQGLFKLPISPLTSKPYNYFNLNNYSNVVPQSVNPSSYKAHSKDLILPKTCQNISNLLLSDHIKKVIEVVAVGILEKLRLIEPLALDLFQRTLNEQLKFLILDIVHDLILRNRKLLKLANLVANQVFHDVLHTNLQMLAKEYINSKILSLRRSPSIVKCILSAVPLISDETSFYVSDIADLADSYTEYGEEADEILMAQESTKVIIPRNTFLAQKYYELWRMRFKMRKSGKILAQFPTQPTPRTTNSTREMHHHSLSDHVLKLEPKTTFPIYDHLDKKDVYGQDYDNDYQNYIFPTIVKDESSEEKPLIASTNLKHDLFYRLRVAVDVENECALKFYKKYFCVLLENSCRPSSPPLDTTRVSPKTNKFEFPAMRYFDVPIGDSHHVFCYVETRSTQHEPSNRDIGHDIAVCEPDLLILGSFESSSTTFRDSKLGNIESSLRDFESNKFIFCLQNDPAKLVCSQDKNIMFTLDYLVKLSLIHNLTPVNGLNGIATTPNKNIKCPLNLTNLTSSLFLSINRQLALQLSPAFQTAVNKTLKASNLVEYLYHKICREPYKKLILCQERVNWIWPDPRTLFSYFNDSVLPMIYELLEHLVLVHSPPISWPPSEFIAKTRFASTHIGSNQNLEVLEKVREILESCAIPELAYFLASQATPEDCKTLVEAHVCSSAPHQKGYLNCIRTILGTYYNGRERSEADWHVIALEIFEIQMSLALKLLGTENVLLQTSLDLTLLEFEVAIPPIPILSPSYSFDRGDMSLNLSQQPLDGNLKRESPDSDISNNGTDCLESDVLLQNKKLCPSSSRIVPRSLEDTSDGNLFSSQNNPSSNAYSFDIYDSGKSIETERHVIEKIHLRLKKLTEDISEFKNSKVT